MRSGVISMLFPTPQQTELLRACLWSGADARAAWLRWQRAVGDARPALIAADSGSRALLALLHDAVRRNDLAIDPALRGALAVAAFAEERRAGTYQRICARAFSALSAASIPFLVLKGAALADTVYPDPSLRHSHDIDVLIHAHDRDRAAAAVRHAGFIATPSHPGPARLVDASGLPLELHVGLFRLARYSAPLAEIWQRSTRSRIAGEDVRTLGAADHLVHILGQASCCGSRDTLKWVCDAWYLISRSADLAWEVFLRAAGESRAALPLAAITEFLAARLRAPVPGSVLDGLSTAARSADRAAQEASFDGIRAGRRGRLRSMLRHARTGRERAALLRWRLLRLPRGDAAARSIAPLEGRNPGRAANHRRIAADSPTTTAFLAACLRLRHDPGAIEAAREASRRLNVSSAALLEAIDRERIGPLLHHTAGARALLPRAVAEAVRQSYRVTGARNVLLLRELRHCLHALAAAGVPAIVLKGAALADAVYRNASLRPMLDLDLLVRRRDIPAARRALEELGFALDGIETHPGARAEHENELALSKPGPVPVSIDMHWSLVDSPYYQSRMAMDWFWETARTLPIAGGPALTFGTEALLLHLSAHLILHHGGTGLLWWNDLIEVAAFERGRVDWLELCARARHYELRLAAREVLARLAAEWHVPVPSDVLGRLAAEPPSRRESELFALMQSGAPVGQRFWTDLAGMPDWRQRMRFARTNLLPSAAYMRQRYGIRHRLLLPVYYPYRWMRGIAGLR
jgi:Uncharacterised nucleotidyltransferase